MNYEVGKGIPPRDTRFKKGYSGNPEGARKHNELKKTIKKITLEELSEIIKNTVTMTERELVKELESGNKTVMQKIVGKALLKVAKNGDYKTFSKIIEPIIGKC